MSIQPAASANEPLSFRQAPHNLEAEQALLGAILVDNEALDRVSGFLSPDHFYDPLHGRIFETLATLIHAGKTATPITVKTFFENAEPIDSNMSVPQYLGRLAANATTIINAAEYGRTVYDLATRRALIVIGEDMVNTAYDSAVDHAPKVQIEEAERLLALLSSDVTVRPKREAISAASLHDAPVPPRVWHVRDYLPHRTVTMLSGDGGTGKSLLALQLAFATATGGNWIGQDVARGDVLYIGAEDDQDELHRRLAEITAGESMSFESLSRLHLLCLAGEDAVLATFDKSNVMTKTPVWQSVVRNVERIRPRLVVFDTLADLFGGDEINRSQTKQFIQLLIGLALRYDLTVLLLSHPSIAGMKTNAGTSGSTAWSNSVRSRLYLNRVKDARDTELDSDARILTIKKANYGPVGASISLRWANGIFRPSDTDANASEAVNIGNIRAENAFLELLRIFTEQGRDVSANHSRSYAPKLFADEDLGKKVGKVALASAMTRLRSDGRVRSEVHGPASKRRSKLVLQGSLPTASNGCSNGLPTPVPTALPTPFRAASNEAQRCAFQPPLNPPAHARAEGALEGTLCASNATSAMNEKSACSKSSIAGGLS